MKYKSVFGIGYKNVFFRWGLLWVVLLLTSCDSASHSNLTKESQGKGSGIPCSGYDAERGTWGWDPRSGLLFLSCPKNHAYFGCTQGSALRANCCPLARNDVLTEEHKMSVARCLDGFVVTGIRQTRASCDPTNTGLKGCDQVFRCTKINSDRYVLGPVTKGSLWGIDSSSAYPWKKRKHIRQNEIPPAIRYGIARGSLHHISHSGCIGDPIGSLLVGRKGRRCKDTLWREVLERSGDKVVKIKLYPECRALDNIYSNEPICVN